MTENPDIVIEKEDVIPYIYFVCSMAQRGRMYGGLSGKSDFIGGIFDRWINIIPENVIFNKFLLPKLGPNLSVISDYYAYDPKKAGIAPDVLGIKIGEEAKPFVKYEERWHAIPNAPQIEVKSFKKDQYMISLRNQGYDSKYLVMVETNLDSDYLLPFFEESLISERTYEALVMDDSTFIKSNLEENLTSITKISRTDSSLGTLRLITVCHAKDFMDFSTLCSAYQSPMYLTNIKETRTTRSKNSPTPLSGKLKKLESGLYSWNGLPFSGNQNHKMLGLFIENIEDIDFIQNSKSSIKIQTRGHCIINDSELEPQKTYILKFQTLDRSGNKGQEYFMQKTIVGKIPSKEINMLDAIKRNIF